MHFTSIGFLKAHALTLVVHSIIGNYDRLAVMRKRRSMNAGLCCAFPVQLQGMKKRAERKGGAGAGSKHVCARRGKCGQQ